MIFIQGRFAWQSRDSEEHMMAPKNMERGMKILQDRM